MKICNGELRNELQGGFTLLELILYITIFSIVGTLAASVFSFALKSKVSIGRLNEVQLDSQRMFAQIVDRVHTATTINDASSTLSLKMADATKDPTIIAVSSSAITLKEGSGAAISITPSTTLVTALTFTLITNPSPSTSSVQIKMTTGYSSAGVADSNTLYSLQTTAMPL